MQAKLKVNSVKFTGDSTCTCMEQSLGRGVYIFEFDNFKFLNRIRIARTARTASTRRPCHDSLNDPVRED